VLAQATSSTEQLAEQLFNLAEAVYPGVFPTGDVTRSYYGFYYRHYPGTGVYLGVVHDPGFGYAANGVYATGGMFGDGLTYGGPVTQFLPPQPVVPTMVSKDLPFTISYASTNFGIDLRSGPVTFAGDETMSGYNFSEQEAPQIGTMSVYEPSGTQTVQIGRWANGTFAGRFYSSVDSTHQLTLNADQGFHYAIATVPATLPCSGSKTYALAASTRPTSPNGAATTGSLDQLAATVTFNGANAPTVAVSGLVTVGGQQRSFSGSAATRNELHPTWQAFYNYNVTSQTAGVGTALAYGSFGGANAAQLGLVLSGLSNGSNSVQFAARLDQTQSTSVACN
jgi:hypothetical protein